MSVWVSGCPVADVTAEKPKLVRSGTKRIAVFRVGDEIRAVDNRCPHEGYALTQGSVVDGVLTCVWHNWKFRLSDGECVLGGEAVRSYPVRVVAGMVEVDVHDPDPETLAPSLFASLLTAMDEVDNFRIARDSSRLLAAGTPIGEIVREAVRWGAARAEYGWDHSLATLADALDLAPYATGKHAVLPAVTALSVVGSDQARRPPRPVASPLSDGLPAPEETVAALRELVEAERADDAEALLRGVIAAGYPRDVLLRAVAVVTSDHFLSFGHDTIYGQKSFELLDQLGWDEAGTVLGPQVYSTCFGTREDLLPYLARFENARRDLAGSPVGTPVAPASLRELIPLLPAAELAAAVHAALDGGRHVSAVLDAITLAAADRLLAFDAAHEANRTSDAGWLDVTHTLTFANAVRYLWDRTREPLLLRSVMHAAWFVSRAARYDGLPVPVEASAPDGPDELDARIDTAVARRDPAYALATATGWLAGGGAEEDLEGAMARAALADGATMPIHVAHCVKTTRAGITERRAHGRGAATWPLLLGPLRYLASPKVERRTLRAVNDANKYVR